MSRDPHIALAQVLEVVQGDQCQVFGATERYITHPAPLDEADGSEAITFCSRGRADAMDRIRATRAGVVVCPEDLSFESSDWESKTLILVDNPRLIFMRIMQALFVKTPSPGIHPTAVIDPETQVHPSAHIGPFTYVGKSEIGEGTVIYGHVHIYSKTRIGRNVVIHANTVIGADWIRL